MHDPLNSVETETEAIQLFSTIFFKLSADLFCIVGTDGYLKRINPAWTQVLGWRQEELLSHPWIEFLHPAEVVPALSLPQSEKITSEFSFKNRHRHKDGTYRWISWKACQYKNGLTYIVGRDITEQQELEAALRQSEQHYRTLVETSRDLIWSVDPDGRWTFVNPAFKQIYGYEPHEAIGRPFLEFVAPEQRDLDWAAFNRLKAGESLFQYETEHRRKDGTPVFLSYNAAVMHDDRGNIIGTTGTATDITERKQQEAALKQQEQKLAIHLQNTPLAAIEWNLNFEVSDWNPAAEKMFGYTRQEAIGQHALFLVPDCAKPIVSVVLDALLSQQGGIYSTNENITKDGRTIVCEWHNTPLVDSEGRPIGVASLVQDVTEKIAAIRALEESERRFQKLADNVPGVIYQFFVTTDNQLSFPVLSSGCRELFEVEAEYLKSHPQAIKEMIHPEDLPSYYESIKMPVQTLVPWLWEGRYILPSGKIKWLRCAARPERKENGDYLWDGIILDVTDRKEAEEALTRSEAKWRSLIQNSSDMILILEMDGTIRYNSPSVERILGYSSEELLGRNATSFVHPDDLHTLTHTYEILCAHPNTTIKLEYRVRCADDRWVYFESIGCNLLAESAVAGLAINSRDITERKLAEAVLNQTNADLERRVKQRTAELHSSLDQLRFEIIERAKVEAALRESEQRFRAIFEGAAIGIAVRTLDWRIQESNLALQSMLGYPAEELRGKNFLELTHPEDLAWEVELADKMLRGEEDSYQLEKRYLCKNGSSIWGRLSVSLVRTKEGTPQFAIAMVEDISARKQAEAELVLTRKAVESSGDAIAIWDCYGHHIYHNPAFSQLFEYNTPEELNAAGGPKALFADPDIATQVLDRITSGHSWSGEVVKRSKSDRMMPVLMRADAIEDPGGKIVGSIGVCTDISDRVRAEEELKKALYAAEAANRSKSTFLANMSHELRTPLNAIIGYSEILTEDLEDLGYHEALPDLSKICTAGKHLLSLINDILDISKIEAGRMTLYLERFEVSELIQQVVSTVQPLVEKNHNTLQAICDRSVDTMYADVTKVRQILLNLLSNAAKFTTNGSICLKVTVHPSVASNGDRFSPRSCDRYSPWIRFDVTDSGIGISREQLQTIFDAFSQADPSTTRKYGGTGLGLAIGKRFCEMMGGEISVASDEGKGSTFTLWLPVQVNDVKQMRSA